MRIAAAICTAKWFNKFLILHWEGMLVHSPPPTTARVRGMPAMLGARLHSSVVRTRVGPCDDGPPGDGEERAIHRLCSLIRLAKYFAVI